MRSGEMTGILQPPAGSRQAGRQGPRRRRPLTSESQLSVPSIPPPDLSQAAAGPSPPCPRRDAGPFRSASLGPRGRRWGQHLPDIGRAAARHV